MCLAIPGKIEDIPITDPAARIGRVRFGGIFRDVNLTLLPEARVGDYVLVHAGLAISRLDEKEAQQVFAYLNEMEGSLNRGSETQV